MTHLKGLLIICYLAILPGAASAQNVWDPWLDLINFEPNAVSLIKARNDRNHTQKKYNVQRISKGKGKALNIDEYVVRISTLPNGWSDTQFFAHVRQNLNSFLDQNAAPLKPYTSGDGTDWNSGTNAQLGTIMVFNIIIENGPDDLAAVVVSRTANLSWVFSPITDGISEVTSEWGTHPVAGNRMFGLRKSGNDYEFFTRGADRVFPSHVSVFENQAFKGADVLWLSLQSNLGIFINDNGGSATISNPNVPGGNDKDQKPQWTTVCNDSDVVLGRS